MHPVPLSAGVKSPHAAGVSRVDPFAASWAVADVPAAYGLFAAIAHEPFEIAVLAYVDGDRHLLGMRHTRSSNPGLIDIDARTVAQDILMFEAEGLLMAHNHPAGDPTPSERDLAVTLRLAAMLRVLGVTLHDHVILAGSTGFSMREARMI